MRRHPMDEQMVQEKVEVQGTYDERFRAVYDVLDRQLNNGDDIGSSAAVFIDGKPVVDIWGGYIDEARTRPWERDTIVNTFSTTKPMTALCAAWATPSAVQPCATSTARASTVVAWRRGAALADPGFTTTSTPA
jgi:Beta-lactamase